MSTLRTTTAMALMTGAALTASASASAQVYKCPDASGRTVIQQMPCTGGEKMKVPSTGATNADVADARGKAAGLCEAALRSAPAWKDRDSVRISRVSRVGFTTVQMHGTTLAVVQYVAAQPSGQRAHLAAHRGGPLGGLPRRLRPSHARQ